MSNQPSEYDSEGQRWQEESMMTQSSSTIMTPQPGMMTPQPGMMVPMSPHRDCRNNAKLVAYTTMVFNFLHLIFWGICIIFLIILMLGVKRFIRTALKIPEDEPFPPQFETIIMGIRITLGVAIFVLLIVAGFVLLELFIAWGLLTATRIGTPPGQAIKKAKCWFCCHICLVILNILSLGCFAISPSNEMDSLGGASYSNNPQVQQADTFTISFGGINVVLLVIRLLFMYIVHNFIQQLNSVGYLGM